MRKILLCFMALLLVMMVALIASVGLSPPVSESSTAYNVCGIPVTDIQVVAGIAAVALLAAVMAVIGSGTLHFLKLQKLMLVIIIDVIVLQNHQLSINISRKYLSKHFRAGFSWRTPLIKPI